MSETDLHFVKSGSCNASCIGFSLVKLLRLSGYDAAVCASRGQGSGKVPGGDHEYIDVINYDKGSSERLIIDIDFRSHFEIARAVDSYDRILNSLPNFVFILRFHPISYMMKPIPINSKTQRIVTEYACGALQRPNQAAASHSHDRIDHAYQIFSNEQNLIWVLTTLQRIHDNQVIYAGDHDYIDVINYNKGGSERLIVDIDFRSHFEIARGVDCYDRILNSLPVVYVGSLTRLKQSLQLMVDAAGSSLKQNSMPFPPWRSLAYLQAKWQRPTRDNLLPVNMILKTMFLLTINSATGI
ncbi:Uncharacterized protein TCM_042762 [Theobroma cacao]|uniref:Uncharacterized protein n=1 Tax=Theobroma cacao TaxID=3641 RepID=A0A061FM66_THECC|nr:Uncharacterized protein TCM_042762 [Theobroma cacao]